MRVKASRFATLFGLVSLFIAACTPAGSSTSSNDSGGSAARIQRVLVGGLRAESSNVALKPLGAGFTVNSLVTRIFNADLTRIDDRGAIQPYLAETLPQLNTDSWRVLADGRMEVTWKFRPGIVWQDGTQFSMEDFLFAWQVYRKPDYKSGNSEFAKVTQEVAAADDRTLVVSYKVPFPDALTDTLPPLPRHLLTEPFDKDDPNAFANEAYWSRAYIGLGPWTLTHWEPGAFVEGVAFDQHILGRPQIDRIRVMFIGEPNTALANVLAGEVHFSTAGTFITVEQGRELKRQWDQTGGGTVSLYGPSWRVGAFQFRPETATPAALLDPRVRRALAYGVDKGKIVDAIFGPESNLAVDFFVQPDSIYGGPALEAALTKYPYDPRRAEQLMNEVGFTRGPNGVYVNASGRFRIKLETLIGADDMTIMASDWRTLGFDVEDSVVPVALAQDPVARALFSGVSLYTAPQLGQISTLTSAQCPKSETGYRFGNNRGCWQNAEFERLSTAFSTTLDPQERAAQVAAMAKVYTEELPQIPLFLAPQAHFWVSGLKGVKEPTSDGYADTNIYEWEWIK